MDGMYNPDFISRVQLKRELAAMKRQIDEAEARARETDRAAREAADAILAAAFEEARVIMRRAYDAPALRPVAEIIGEVAIEHHVPARSLRERGGTRAVRAARRAALRRTLRERVDLTDAEIGRIFGGLTHSTVREARLEVANG